MNYLFSYFKESIISKKKSVGLAIFGYLANISSTNFAIALDSFWLLNTVGGRAFQTIFFVSLSTKLNLKVPSL
jgi:hypothetical protein